MEENVVYVSVCACLGSLFEESLCLKKNSICLLYYGRKCEYSRPLVKSKTNPWPRHSTWKQIKFQWRSPWDARDLFGWQATQETSRGSPLHSLHMPKNATVTVRAGTQSVCKYIVFTSMECQTGGLCHTGQYRESWQHHKHFSYHPVCLFTTRLML